MKLEKQSKIFLNFLIGIISATGCSIVEKNNCPANNFSVLGISALNNAHVELLSYNNYDYVLCCDFGTGNTTCSGGNEVISLGQEYNSHIAIPYSNDYFIDVCYEDLVCSPRNTCLSSEVSIYSLSDLSDTHIASAGFYDIQMCCSAESWNIVPVDDDWDDDGILNIHDPDANGDGVLDSGYEGIDPNGDIDGDGILNIDDPDIDGDGILNGDDDTPFGEVEETFCGNGILETGEECDDGNTGSGDGCSSVCVIESSSGSSSSSSNSNKCNPKWECSSWGSCINNIQTRDCIDIRNCGTSRDRPIEIQTCGVILDSTTEIISLGSTTISPKESNSSLQLLSGLLLISILVMILLIVLVLLWRR